MTRYLIIIGLLLLFPIVRLQAQEENINFYLLRTGYLLEGTADLNGKNYAVRTSFGSMNVPAQNVEFVGKTKKDVYLYKKNNVDSSNVNALIQFAEWCLGNGLTQEGITEYQRARQIVSNGTLAAVIQQRLEGLQYTEIAVAPIQTPMPLAEIPPKPAFPQSVFENYVRSVQPILVNRCVSADCHGTHSQQQFKMAIPHTKLGSTSRRNLQAVLTCVNLSHPTESLLLSALTTPHGNMKTVLSVESDQYLQTVRWVQQVAKELPLEQNSDEVSKAVNEPAAQNVSVTPKKVLVLPEQFRRAISQWEHPPQQQKGSDPLDPNIFNSQYH